MSKQMQQALDLCVRAIDNLLPGAKHIPADVGLVNAALMTARPLLEVPTYPRHVADHIVQYDDNVFVWYDEAGLAGGAAETLEVAEAQLSAYVQCLEVFNGK